MHWKLALKKHATLPTLSKLANYPFKKKRKKTESDTAFVSILYTQRQQIYAQQTQETKGKFHQYYLSWINSKDN